jgi:5'-3' exonuclease
MWDNTVSLVDKNMFLVAVDADIVAYRVAAGCEDEDEEILLDTMRANLYQIWRKTKANNYLFCLTGETNFRNEVATSRPYKGNRKDVVRPKWLNRARQFLLEEANALIVEGYEADDLLVSVSHLYGNGNVAIASIDKDLLQCQGYHYHLVKGEACIVTTTQARNFMWEQVLKGDATDNIMGLANVGPKKAVKILADGASRGEPAAFTVRKAYENAGMGYENYLENLLLIRMVTNVDYDYCNHFVQLPLVGGTGGYEYLEDDFDDEFGE